MAFTKTLFLSLLAVLSVNTIAIAPIHAVGVGERECAENGVSGLIASASGGKVR